jgi:hypothetical protein
MIRAGVLFLAVAGFAGLLAQAQKPTVITHGADVDVAITYVAERAKIASIDCGCFWLQGGSGDLAITFSHGLGVAANLTGVHAANVAPGIDLDKVLFAMGPRYTYDRGRWALFGEALFGGAHAFNTIFPSSTGVVGGASSYAMMFGGGLDFQAARHIRLRALEADYVRSTLPNNANNTQNDLRLAAGLSFHFNGVH